MVINDDLNDQAFKYSDDSNDFAGSWLNQPIWKICKFVKLDPFVPRLRDENSKKYVKNATTHLW